jgi:hypothetical protein
MMTVAYLLLIAATVSLVLLGLEARFHLIHHYKRRRTKAFWRDRRRRESRGR